MQIVIDIPENVKNTIDTLDDGFDAIKEACYGSLAIKAIQNGTPLPKGHGDLIDRNELLKHYDSKTYYNGIEERKIHFVQIGYVNDAPTIVEADDND